QQALLCLERLVIGGQSLALLARSQVSISDTLVHGAVDDTGPQGEVCLEVGDRTLPVVEAQPGVAAQEGCLGSASVLRLLGQKGVKRRLGGGEVAAAQRGVR